ncbi:MAG: GNAT family N-acetyltransferase [Acidothermaceae bacterium]
MSSRSSVSPALPDDLAWSIVRSDVDERLRDELTICWADVSNAGGAVGFPVTPVSFSDVRPAVDELAAKVAVGECALVVAGDAAGTCGWVVLQRNTFALTTHWGWVRRLQVHPRRQRQGIARELLRRLEQVARDEWRLEFLQLVLRGGLGLENFYDRLGWREVGRIPGALRAGDGDDRDEVHMVKPLAGIW